MGQSGDGQRLGVGELVDSLAAQLTTVSRLLDAAEREPRVGANEVVDGAATRLELIARNRDAARVLRLARGRIAGIRRPVCSGGLSMRPRPAAG